MNIIEFIDAIITEEEPTPEVTTKNATSDESVSITTYYRELPKDAYGLLIAETAINGVVKSFAHYEGEINSTIQLYLRMPSTSAYTEDVARLKGYYNQIKDSMGSEVDGLKLLWVEPFLLNDSKDEKGNNIYSMIFEVIYKE